MSRPSPRQAGAAALVSPSKLMLAWLAACAALLLLVPQPAQAQCDARLQCCATPRAGGDPGACDPGAPAEVPPSGPGTGAGNPIDIVSGNKHQREVDLPRLPGVLGLELVRHYNSALADHDTGGLGRGWRLSYEAELRDGAQSLTIVQADGRTLRFMRGIANPDTYVAADPADGRVQRHADGPGGLPFHVWTWPGGRSLRFSMAS